MLVNGAKFKSTKIQGQLMPKEGGQGVYKNKMAVAR